MQDWDCEEGVWTWGEKGEGTARTRIGGREYRMGKQGIACGFGKSVGEGGEQRKRIGTSNMDNRKEEQQNFGKCRCKALTH